MPAVLVKEATVTQNSPFLPIIHIISITRACYLLCNSDLAKKVKTSLIQKMISNHTQNLIAPSLSQGPYPFNLSHSWKSISNFLMINLVNRQTIKPINKWNENDNNLPQRLAGVNKSQKQDCHIAKCIQKQPFTGISHGNTSQKLTNKYSKFTRYNDKNNTHR